MILIPPPYPPSTKRLGKTKMSFFLLSSRSPPGSGLFLGATPLTIQVNELLEFPDNPHAILVSTVDTAQSHSMFT